MTIPRRYHSRVKNAKGGNFLNEILSRIEAILFAYGDPIEARKLAQATGIPINELSVLITALNDRYSDTESALKVDRLGDCYQIVTRHEYAEYINNTFEMNRSTALSPSAMEVLTIVAYNQPVTKSFIESVRGVDSSHVLGTLIQKGLVVEAERLNVVGHPISYVTTPIFLRSFGLNDISELPPLPHHVKQSCTDNNNVQLRLNDQKGVESL